MLQTTYQVSRPCGFRQEYCLKDFLLAVMATRILHEIKIFKQFLKGGHPKSSPVKFGAIPFSSLAEDGRRTSEDHKSTH